MKKQHHTLHSKEQHASHNSKLKYSEKDIFYMKNTVAILIAALSILILDQLTKFFVRSQLKLGESAPVIGNLLRIEHSSNTGIAFSLLQGNIWIPAWISILAIAAILIFHDSVRNVREGVFLGLILGGIMGNLIDRLTFRAVTDFISFSFWPSFNIADIGLTVGAIGLAILIYFRMAKK